MSAPPNRFLILAGARTGSTFLKNLLRSHPDVICFGEIFNKSKILWDLGEFNERFNTLDLLRTRDANPASFASQVFDLGAEDEGKSVGFKLLYRHLSLSPRHQELIPYLLRNDDIRLVHLKRRNAFKTYCSLKIATLREARGTSMNAYREDDVEQNISIKVDPEDCLRFLKANEINEAKYNALFAHRQPLELHYEDLAADVEETMGTVLRYLGLPHAPMSAGTYKVRQQPIHDVVANYKEVAAYLTDRGYEKLFG